MKMQSIILVLSLLLILPTLVACAAETPSPTGEALPEQGIVAVQGGYRHPDGRFFAHRLVLYRESPTPGGGYGEFIVYTNDADLTAKEAELLVAGEPTEEHFDRVENADGTVSFVCRHAVVSVKHIDEIPTS